MKLDEKSFRELKLFIIGKKKSIDNFEKYKELGAIVESDDEILTVHKYSSKILDFCSGLLELWICMTNECNFRCSYCFEKKTKDVLNVNLIDKIIDFIKGKNL